MKQSKAKETKKFSSEKSKKAGMNTTRGACVCRRNLFGGRQLNMVLGVFIMALAFIAAESWAKSSSEDKSRNILYTDPMAIYLGYFGLEYERILDTSKGIIFYAGSNIFDWTKIDPYEYKWTEFSFGYKRHPKSPHKGVWASVSANYIRVTRRIAGSNFGEDARQLSIIGSTGYKIHPWFFIINPKINYLYPIWAERGHSKNVSVQLNSDAEGLLVKT